MYSNVRGTIDFSEEQALFFQRLKEKSIDLFNLFGYQQLILPLLEERGLFIKGVGQNTDIVQSQMLKIEGKNIVLRPEATAQTVRYYLQHRLDKKNSFYKFFYIGPMFRGERPQKGRLRQFNHIGAEVVGSKSFCLDAEIIKLAVDIVEAAGIKKKELQINSLGCAKDKDRLSEAVKKGLDKEKNKLCVDCRRRIEKNPLRVVDCKRPGCKEFVSLLGLGKKHLCPDCRSHFDNLSGVLDDLGVIYKHNPYLVRGLDYYTNTVFEILSDRLGSQDALGAGGRYNNLFNRLGKIDLPAVGFALGVERIILALGDCLKAKKSGSVFIAQAGSNLEKRVLFLLNDLRNQNIVSYSDFRGKSLKAQMRYGQKSGADFVLILGEKELTENKVILRDMKNSKQEKVDLNQLIPKLKISLKRQVLC